MSEQQKKLNAEIASTVLADHRRAMSAAERMRRHRERRRKGLRCLLIQLGETEINALICQGLLKPEMRNNPGAVRKAFYTFLDGTLGGTQ
jgi:hypothetical protein